MDNNDTGDELRNMSGSGEDSVSTALLQRALTIQRRSVWDACYANTNETLQLKSRLDKTKAVTKTTESSDYIAER